MSSSNTDMNLLSTESSSREGIKDYPVQSPSMVACEGRCFPANWCSDKSLSVLITVFRCRPMILADSFDYGGVAAKRQRTAKEI